MSRQKGNETRWGNHTCSYDTLAQVVLQTKFPTWKAWGSLGNYCHWAPAATGKEKRRIPSIYQMMMVCPDVQIYKQLLLLDYLNSQESHELRNKGKTLAIRGKYFHVFTWTQAHNFGQCWKNQVRTLFEVALFTCSSQQEIMCFRGILTTGLGAHQQAVNSLDTDSIGYCADFVGSRKQVWLRFNLTEQDIS